MLQVWATMWVKVQAYDKTRPTWTGESQAISSCTSINLSFSKLLLRKKRSERGTSLCCGYRNIQLLRSDLFDFVAVIMASFSGDETAPFFGFLGAAAALVFSCMGAAYGTAKSGVGVASMGVMRPELVMKSIVPVVMAGVLGIYGLIIAVIISTGINPKAKSYYLFDGYAHLSSGLACGLAGLSAGMAIGIVGDAGVRANAQQPKLFVGMILILIFAEALALYGLIVGIILSSRAGQSRAD
ncbi:hypothetical protein VNO80_24343 [Phaseolus coccineus]